MENILIIKSGFQPISLDIVFRDSILVAGKNLWQSKHVSFLEEKKFSNFSIITANVIRERNVTLHPYEVFLEVLIRILLFINYSLLFLIIILVLLYFLI